MKETREQTALRVALETRLTYDTANGRKRIFEFARRYDEERAKLEEPVCWVYESKQGHRLLSEKRKLVHAYEVETPLFTRPASQSSDLAESEWQRYAMQLRSYCERLKLNLNGIGRLPHRDMPLLEEALALPMPKNTEEV